MTQPNNVEVDYLDTSGNAQTFVGDAATIQVLGVGILYSATDASNQVLAEYLFPWSRILRLVTPAGVYGWSGI